MSERMKKAKISAIDGIIQINNPEFRYAITHSRPGMIKIDRVTGRTWLLDNDSQVWFPMKEKE